MPIPRNSRKYIATRPKPVIVRVTSTRIASEENMVQSCRLSLRLRTLQQPNLPLRLWFTWNINLNLSRIARVKVFAKIARVFCHYPRRPARYGSGANKEIKLQSDPINTLG